MSKGAGTSLGGWVQSYESKEEKSKKWKKEKAKSKRAKVCMTCDQHDNGWCLKYKGWCNKTSLKCADVQKPKKRDNKKKK